MKSFALLSVLTTLATTAYGLTINTPSSIVQCEPSLLSWSDGTAPYYLSILPGGETTATALESFSSTSDTSYTWTVDIASGTSITLSIKDSTGTVAYSDTITIQSSSDSSCLSSSSASGTSSGSTSTGTSGTTATGTSSTGTATGSSTGTSTSSSSSSSSSSGAIRGSSMNAGILAGVMGVIVGSSARRSCCTIIYKQGNFAIWATKRLSTIYYHSHLLN
ncbi:hypothetical protein PNOK_0825600 [Pyrrhoderma noxium]|uniref:Uncharacterized protein n=1 Tax=Pyrrhoderma noxium TaxID=2282107 RepID=A0A286UAR2_9AGAM|nr:hypothetical protein PNOK_0825600 [Pyrrhoderma noxium]